VGLALLMTVDVTRGRKVATSDMPGDAPA